MTPVPLDLPLRPSEAAELASLIFESAERKPLTDEVRNRVAARAIPLRFETIAPHFGSLARDPVHPSTYYIAVDVDKGPPQLLHVALATAPTSSIFHKPLLVGRMRRALGPEIVINTIPFGPEDIGTLEKFATHIDTAFLPRPHGTRCTVVAGVQNAGPGISSLFEAFRAIAKRTGRNVAAIGVTGDRDVRAVYYAALWAAIRSGWRDGYSAVLRVRGPLESAKSVIGECPLFSTFAIDPADLIRDTINEPFESIFPASDRGWIFDEFVRTFNLGESAYEFTPEEVLQLAVRFGEGLLFCERLRNHIRQTRSVLKINRPFDFELALDRVPQVTTAKELIFCLHWLKARGHAAQLVAPHLPLGASLEEAAAICRHFQCALDLTGEAPAGGRFTCSLWDGDTTPAAIERVAP